MFVALCLVVALCVWVGWSFKNSRFDYVWPITVLRWYGKIFFQILDIASMSVFLVAMDCGYFGVGNSLYNQEFPDQACFQMPHLIHLVVALISLMLFVAMAITYQVADMELNPLSKNLIAMGHSK
jgi:ABC-type spermidine/putrescine transport system permease subunit II